MLEPSQFKVNEAWVVFQLNDSPIRTEQDGNFNCVALMDAASGFILGTAFVSASDSEPSDFEARRLFKAGWAHKKQHPVTLFIPKGQFQAIVPAEAARHGITVVSVHESELSAFTNDARKGFREHVQGRRA